MTEPKLFTEAEAQDRFGDKFTAELRERGLIAPEPDAIDRLRNALDDLHGIFLDRDKMMEVCHRADIELAPRVELTRKMVRALVIDARPKYLSPGDFNSRYGKKNKDAAEAFVTRLHATLQEQLKEAGRGA